MDNLEQSRNEALKEFEEWFKKNSFRPITDDHRISFRMGFAKGMEQGVIMAQKIMTR